MDAPCTRRDLPAPHSGQALVAAIWLGLVLLALMGIRAPAAGAASPRVLEAPLTGTVDPVMADFVDRVLDEARDERYDAVVFTLDTPGGLMTSMDDIVKRFLNERKLPIFVYVAPSGAEAASAGVFLTMASDVAAMAPSTNLGSATPINGDGSNIGKDLRRKVINNAVAKLEGLAKEHGRNTDFAESAIRTADNLSAREALRKGVVEFVEPDLASLLDAADGTVTKPKGLKVRTASADVTHTRMPWTLGVLKLLINPNIVFLLFSGGVLGLAFELTHPGVFFPGVAGAILLVMALYGLQVLPVTSAGVILLILAATFIAIEIAFPTHGVMGVGGAVCLFLGGLLLFDRGSPFAIDIAELLVISGAFVALFGFIIQRVVAARRAPVTTGHAQLIDAEGVVRRGLAPAGTVFVHGEIWQARSVVAGVDVPAGRRVRVEQVDGLVLMVRDTGVEETESGRDGRSDRPPTELTTQPSPDD